MVIISESEPLAAVWAFRFMDLAAVILPQMPARGVNMKDVTMNHRSPVKQIELQIVRIMVIEPQPEPLTTLSALFAVRDKEAVFKVPLVEWLFVTMTVR